jgi:hypothetical protein
VPVKLAARRDVFSCYEFHMSVFFSGTAGSTRLNGPLVQQRYRAPEALEEDEAKRDARANREHLEQYGWESQCAQ